MNEPALGLLLRASLWTVLIPRASTFSMPVCYLLHIRYWRLAEPVASA